MMLISAALLNFAISILHVAIVVIGPAAYLCFGAGPDFASAAADGDLWPHAVTLALAGIFSIWGLICLSYAGVLPRLPLVGWDVLAIATVYSMRGLAIVVQAFGVVLFDGGDGAIGTKDLILSAVALCVGIVHITGWFEERAKSWQVPEKSEQPHYEDL